MPLVATTSHIMDMKGSMASACDDSSDAQTTPCVYISESPEPMSPTTKTTAGPWNAPKTPETPRRVVHAGGVIVPQATPASGTPTTKDNKPCLLEGPLGLLDPSNSSGRKRSSSLSEQFRRSTSLTPISETLEPPPTFNRSHSL